MIEWLTISANMALVDKTRVRALNENTKQGTINKQNCQRVAMRLKNCVIVLFLFNQGILLLLFFTSSEILCKAFAIWKLVIFFTLSQWAVTWWYGLLNVDWIHCRHWGKQITPVCIRWTPNFTIELYHHFHINRFIFLFLHFC